MRITLCNSENDRAPRKVLDHFEINELTSTVSSFFRKWFTVHSNSSTKYNVIVFFGLEK